MKKILLLMCILIIAFVFVSCKSNDLAYENNTVTQDDSAPVFDSVNTDVDLALIKDNIIKSVQIKDPIMVETSRLKNLYGIEETSVKQSACFVTMDGVFPAEIIMIEAKDSANAEKIAELLENRLNEVKIQSQSYDPENYKLAQQCTVDINGNYVTMFLTAEHREMKNIYNEFIK